MSQNQSTPRLTWEIGQGNAACCLLELLGCACSTSTKAPVTLNLHGLQANIFLKDALTRNSSSCMNGFKDYWTTKSFPPPCDACCVEIQGKGTFLVGLK